MITRRYLTQAAIIVAIMAVLATTAWWSGAAVARLSATPTAVEPSTAGHVRLRVELRNEGWTAARPASVAEGTDPEVRTVVPHATPVPDAILESESHQMLPTTWTLRGGESRQLTLDFRVACDTPPSSWRLRMISYVRGNGSDTDVPWNDDKLPDWRTRALDAVCR